MKSALVSIDAHTGTLTRYETGGPQRRKTHAATLDRAAEFTPEVVEQFRRFPPSDFYVGPPLPIPGGDAPSGAPVAIAA